MPIKPDYATITAIVEGDEQFDPFSDDKSIAALYRAAESWLTVTGKTKLSGTEQEVWQYYVDRLKREIEQTIVALWMSEMDR